MEVENRDVKNSEEDDEYEEEEILVELKFEGGNLHESLLNQPGVHFKLIGATTPKPVLQLGDQMFAGQYVDAMGTTVIFEEDDSMPYYDPVFSMNPETPLRYYARTRKCLLMSRIFIKEKKEGEEAQGEDKQEGEEAPGDDNKEDAGGEQDREPNPEPSSPGHEADPLQLKLEKPKGEAEGMEEDDDVAEEVEWETDEET